MAHLYNAQYKLARATRCFELQVQLADRLNEKDLPAIGGLIDPKVTCYTCHRGSKKPATKPPEAPAAAPAAPPTPPKAERG